MLLERETTIQKRFYVKFSTPVILAFKKLAKFFLPTLMKNSLPHFWLPGKGWEGHYLLLGASREFRYET